MVYRQIVDRLKRNLGKSAVTCVRIFPLTALRVQALPGLINRMVALHT
jgi:hypothetical protein